MPSSTPTNRPRAGLRLACLAAGLAAPLALGALPAPLGGALPAAAQEAGAAGDARAQTLADIRQQLSVLHVEVQGLKRELSTTGAPSELSSGGGQLERVNAIEAELRRLTGKTEELEHRIDRIVADGTQRIGDLEFRLVELEGGDVSQLGETTTLGGGAAAATGGAGTGTGTGTGTGMTGAAAGGGGTGTGSATGAGRATGSAAPQGAPAPQLAVSEEADFRAASEHLSAGDFAAALEGYESFKSTYPGSPLEPDADLGRGRALEGQGDIQAAARAYLDAFSAAPRGQTAPEALYRLGVQLGTLGQSSESCETLGALDARFPASEWATRAASARQQQGCS